MPGRAFPRREGHPFWKGAAASDDAKRRRVVYEMPALGRCSRCPSPATERHHRDRDLDNDARENIEPLCRECHKEEHRPQQSTPPVVCAVCGRSSKRSWSGRCPSCSSYFQRHGEERPPRLYARPTRAERKEEGGYGRCTNCGRPTTRPWKGRCGACARYYSIYTKERGKELYERNTHPKGAEYCLRGHRYDEQNTYVTPSGGRACRACISARQRLWKEGRKDGELAE